MIFKIFPYFFDAETYLLFVYFFRYYLLSLKQSDENNLSIFRVISLWLDNPDLDFADEEHGSFGHLLREIPSWKFITVLPQLAPRISKENTAFAEYLRQIMSKFITICIIKSESLSAK